MHHQSIRTWPKDDRPRENTCQENMNPQAKSSTGTIAVYQNKVEVRLENETVWLTQNQMADLFHIERSVITKHIRNVLKIRELRENSVCAKFAHTATDGKVYQTQYYNLDMIISVGYRVNSKRGTQFRIWATQVLRKHLVDGFTINEQQLKSDQHKYQELQRSLKLLGNLTKVEGLSDEAKGIAQVIADYSRALNLLDDFDHRRLATPKGTKKNSYKLTYEKAKAILDQMRRKFKGSSVVGQPKDESFKSSLGAIYQTFESRDLYPTVEEKAAQLLYFVTKNHSFVDGNKRIAAALFVAFLQGNGLLLRKDGSKRIDDHTLVALTLMIAASHPQEKDAMIKLILNLFV